MTERANKPADDSPELRERARPMFLSELRVLVQELTRIGRKDAPHHESSSYFLSTARGRTREIGQQLDRLAGWGMMSAAHQLVRLELGNIAARELELAWDGIGKWEA